MSQGKEEYRGCRHEKFWLLALEETGNKITLSEELPTIWFCKAVRFSYQQYRTLLKISLEQKYSQYNFTFTVQFAVLKSEKLGITPWESARKGHNNNVESDVIQQVSGNVAFYLQAWYYLLKISCSRGCPNTPTVHFRTLSPSHIRLHVWQKMLCCPLACNRREFPHAGGGGRHSPDLVPWLQGGVSSKCTQIPAQEQARGSGAGNQIKTCLLKASSDNLAQSLECMSSREGNPQWPHGRAATPGTGKWSPHCICNAGKVKAALDRHTKY